MFAGVAGIGGSAASSVAVATGAVGGLAGLTGGGEAPGGSSGSCAGVALALGEMVQMLTFASVSRSAGLVRDVGGALDRETRRASAAISRCNRLDLVLDRSEGGIGADVVQACVGCTSFDSCVTTVALEAPEALKRRTGAPLVGLVSEALNGRMRSWASCGAGELRLTRGLEGGPARMLVEALLRGTASGSTTHDEPACT